MKTKVRSGQFVYWQVFKGFGKIVILFTNIHGREQWKFIKSHSASPRWKSVEIQTGPAGITSLWLDTTWHYISPAPENGKAK